MPQEDKAGYLKYLIMMILSMKNKLSRMLPITTKINYTQGSKIMKLVNYLRDNNFIANNCVFFFEK